MGTAEHVTAAGSKNKTKEAPYLVNGGQRGISGRLLVGPAAGEGSPATGGAAGVEASAAGGGSPTTGSYGRRWRAAAGGGSPTTGACGRRWGFCGRRRPAAGLVQIRRETEQGGRAGVGDRRRGCAGRRRVWAGRRRRWTAAAAYKPAEKLKRLICCERKTLFGG
uniref:Uncharacterized protein n=1 Tax=Setaria viridis TaxID=4556 RepID=A0A4U6TU37_SETVI|nr:hypothetical protein SEVIR_8G163000v2 [Setaria viridis]